MTSLHKGQRRLASQVSLSALGTVFSTVGAIALALAATPQLAAAQDSAKDQASNAQTAEGTGITEVIVTAQHRAQSVLKTPIAMTAVTGDSLKASGTDSALRLGNVVPNIQIQRSVGLQISIRGVSNENSLESGDPSAAFNLDGVYIARQNAQGTAFFDLERIEVLRGPQGTLYGRNATGGAINVIPNKPTQNFEASVGAEVGNFNTVRTNAMVNVPVNSHLALRAAVSTNKRDSFLIAGPATQAGVNARLGSDQDDVSARLQALITFKPGTSLRLSADSSDSTALPPMQVVLGNFFTTTAAGPVSYDGGSKLRRTVDWDPSFNGRNKEQIRGLTAEFIADVGIGQLTYIGAHRTFDQRKDEPVYFLGLGQANRDQHFHNNQDSHELRLASEGDGAFKWVVGLYHFSETTTFINHFLPNLPGPLQTHNGDIVYHYRHFDNVAQADSTAAFGQVTWAVTPSLRLTGGLRTTKDSKSRVGANTQQVGANFDATTDISLLNNAAVHYRQSNWKAGIEYDLDKNVMAYASASTGYKAGGYNDGCLATTAGCNNVVPAGALLYAPEHLTAYEAGVKGRYFDNHLQLSVSAFHYDYKNMQLQGISPSTGLVTTANAARSKLDGAELEGKWAASAADTVDFAVSLLDAKYGDYQINAAKNWAGYKLDRAPDYTVQGGYSHRFVLANGGDVVARISSKYSAASFISNFSAARQYEQPGYSRTDMLLTYNAPDDKWYAQVFANNLEDTVRAQGIIIGATYITDPRTFGVRFGAKY